MRKHGPTRDGRTPCRKWYEWLEHMKRKDVKKEKMEEMHQRKVEDFSHKNTMPTMWRGGVQILKKEEEDARLLDRCEAKRKQWAKHWQCDEEIQNMQNKLWRNEELKECEEALPRLKEGDLEKAARSYKAKTGVGRDGFRPTVPLNLA